MERTFFALLLLTVLTMPVLAADYSFGFRWNHFQLLGGGDYWSDYVAGKEFDEWRYTGTDWEPRKTKASAAQSDDFSNFNPIPALQFSLRFEKFTLTTDVEYYKSTEVRITEYNLLPTKKDSPYAYDYEEEAQLTLISIKENFNYLIPYKKGNIYLGGGIGIYSYNMDDELVYTGYKITGKNYSIDERVRYDLSDSGLGFGAQVCVGYEHELTEQWHPFVDLTFQYGVGKYDPDELSTEPYLKVPNEPTSNPKVDDLYGRFHGEIQDSYDITFSAIKINVGMSYWM